MQAERRLNRDSSLTKSQSAAFLLCERISKAECLLNSLCPDSPSTIAIMNKLILIYNRFSRIGPVVQDQRVFSCTLFQLCNPSKLVKTRTVLGCQSVSNSFSADYWLAMKSTRQLFLLAICIRIG